MCGVLMVLVASSCAQGGARRSDWSVPQSLAETSETPLPLDALTPERAAAIALSQHPNAMAVRQQFLARRTQWRQSLWPNLHVSSAAFQAGGQQVRTEFGLAMSLHWVRLLLDTPTRGNMAAQYAQLEAQAQALDIAQRARLAILDWQVADALVGYAQTRLDIATALDGLFQARLAAGNIAALDADNVAMVRQQAQLGLAQAQLNLAVARQKAVAAMGLDAAQAVRATAAPLAEDFPALDLYDMRVDQASAVTPLEARMQQLMVAMARRDSVGLRGLTISPEIGITTENEQGARTRGTEFGANFGWGRNSAALWQTQLQRAQAVRFETQQLYQSIVAQQQAQQRILTQLRDETLPLAQRIVDGTSRDINAMQADFTQMARALDMQQEAFAQYVAGQALMWRLVYSADLLLAGGIAELDMRPPKVDQQLGGADNGH